MSQTDAILADLRAGRSLTQGDALRLYGSSRLAARISDAKALLAPDEEIVAERVTLPSGKHVARYRLAKRRPPETDLQRLVWEVWE